MSAVENAREALNLKDDVQVWAEARGATYDEDRVPVEDAGIEAIRDEYKALVLEDASGFATALYQEWVEHPDGTRSCITAYESR